jgi:hypothetical protein
MGACSASTSALQGAAPVLGKNLENKKHLYIWRLSVIVIDGWRPSKRVVQ